jgi:hypothetical protein
MKVDNQESYIKIVARKFNRTLNLIPWRDL